MLYYAGGLPIATAHLSRAYAWRTEKMSAHKPTPDYSVTSPQRRIAVRRIAVRRLASCFSRKNTHSSIRVMYAAFEIDLPFQAISSATTAITAFAAANLYILFFSLRIVNDRSTVVTSSSGDGNLASTSLQSLYLEEIFNALRPY